MPQTYRIIYSKTAQKDIRTVPKQHLSAVASKISKLATSPRPRDSQKLKGYRNLYRIRQGDYRIVYGIEDMQLVVMVIKIGHRKDVYKQL
ncbi:MAG: type II toxin-antitoxin system RelE/ParE family toxin [Candidatus Saccharimonadales bacterium]